jgi:phosphoglycolate phosphatase
MRWFWPGDRPCRWTRARTYVGGGTRVMLMRALEANGGALPDAEVDVLLPQLVSYYEAHIAVHRSPIRGCSRCSIPLTRGV